MKSLRKFEESDLELLLNFKNSLSPETRQWNLERARRELQDFGHGYGENVLIQEDNGEILSFAGFVKTPIERGEFFIAPFVIKSSGNSILLEKLILIARENKAKWIRASVFSEEIVKKNLLIDYQFYHAFDFITLSFDLCENKVVDSYPTIKLVKIPFDKLDPEKFAKLNNSAFKNVQNAAIIDSKQAMEVFNSFHSYGKLSQVWGDESNKYVGFVEISSDGFIEAVATDPKFQKMGVGRFMLTEVFKNTKDESFSNFKSIISSDNTPSLNLHKGLGFFEVERREVFQLDLK